MSGGWAGRQVHAGWAARVALPAMLIGSLAVFAYVRWQAPADRRDPAPLPVAAPGGLTTSRDDLVAAIAAFEDRLVRDPADATTAARLGEALVRQARVTGNAGLAVRAEEALRGALDATPDHYESLRVLGVVLLSQHRFRDAIEIADRARRMEPRDASNFGVLGDAWLELGEYDRAFDAFDQMLSIRPSAPAYARASYARELQGDLPGARHLMQMALDATTAHDPEAQAWHRCQLGDIELQMGNLDRAHREYAHAAFIYPDYPLALSGQARVTAARGNHEDALEQYRALMAFSPLPEYAARIAELHDAMRRPEDARRFYAIASHGWQYDTPEPVLLARLLATQGHRVTEAVAVAERAAQQRRDIFTMDALAWAYFKAGRIDDARRTSWEALRTGTRDRAILFHAAAIAEAAGEAARAKELAVRALDGHPHFDVVAAPVAAELLRRLELLRGRNLTHGGKFQGSQVSDAGRGPWVGGPRERLS